VNARIWIVLIATLGALSGHVLGGQGGGSNATPPRPPAAVAPSAQDDLMTFVRSAADTLPGVLHVTTMNVAEGPEMPLVVAGAGLADASAKAVHASGKVRVWVQAGSRDGTDAAMMLLRDLAAGRNEIWMTSVVLLISPMAGSSGDDQIELGSPETLALNKALVEYDPHVHIEVKTEDGPCTAYAVTFSPPLHPNTSEYILGVLRDEWFPFVVKNLKNKWFMNAFYRGTVQGAGDGCAPTAPEAAAAPTTPGRRGAPPAAPAGRGGRAGGRASAAAKPAPPPPPEPTIEAAWAAPSHRLAVTANYMGVRNRFAVVGVVHARDAASDRSHAASRFLHEALGFAWAAAARIKKACEDADKQLLVGRSLPTSARPSTIGQVDVLMSAPPAAGAPAAKRTESSTTVTMRDRLRYEPASDEDLAAEYFLPADGTAIVDLLKQHGIQVRQLTQPTKGVEEFTMGAAGPSSPSPQAEGWKRSAAEVPAGTWVVRMNQPLARLAFALLEPSSDESVAALLRAEGKPYTIMRRR
jgi:hypothetical protein